MHFNMNELVFTENDPANFIFIIKYGEVEVLFKKQIIFCFTYIVI